ncbi:MAG: Gfo/Idh/MocA family oxidoreductase [Planctomycetes bacterium]|nr:Gfo/Idh/MocA family oxidoreductase [Planctomycetota bacterium]
MTGTPGSKSSRREFLHSSTSAAVGGALAAQIAFPAVVSGVGTNDTLKIGLVGCGGRGTGAAAQALKADRNAAVTAMGDVFEDQLQSSLELLRKESPDQVKVTSDRCFLGFDAYQKVIDSGADVVLLCTPPGFRAEQLRAAVEAGKHTFVEISCAVDAPGVRSAIESAEVAKKKGLAIVSGCCWRYHYGARGALEQIRNGAIGEVRSVYATYLAADLSHKYYGPRKPSMTELEWQIRDWYNYTWLSGDVTVLLMGGHSVDKMAWWLGDEMPIKAVGTGSRVFPVEGNTYDNCFVAYEYASGIRGFLACRAHDGCHGDYSDYIIGTKGNCTVPHGRVPEVKGETNWRYTGVMNNMHQTEQDELFASIRVGKPINDGTRMAHTTLMAMMGRMAAYTGQEITWEQALNSQERLVPEKLDWNMKLELPPRAMPGLTKFI